MFELRLMNFFENMILLFMLGCLWLALSGVVKVYLAVLVAMVVRHCWYLQQNPEEKPEKNQVTLMTVLIGVGVLVIEILISVFGFGGDLLLTFVCIILSFGLGSIKHRTVFYVSGGISIVILIIMLAICGTFVMMMKF